MSHALKPLDVSFKPNWNATASLTFASTIAASMMFYATVVCAEEGRQHASEKPSAVALPVMDYLLPGKTENIKQYLNDPIFVACKEKATPVGKEGFLGVCTRYDNISGQTDSVIYDSTDEIQKSPSNCSEAWQTVALSLEHQAPFGIQGFDTETIAGHYYRVVFWKSDTGDWPVRSNPK